MTTLTAHTTDGMKHRFPVRVERLRQPLDDMKTLLQQGWSLAIHNGCLEAYPHWDPPFFIYGARSVTHVTDQNGNKVL